MKHRFLLDENILYHAIRGIDRHNQPDLSARELLSLIGNNCHSILVHPIVEQKYLKHLNVLFQDRPPNLQPLYAMIQLLTNSLKRIGEYDDLPELPVGVAVPRKDQHIVQAALLSHPIVITADEELRDAINAQPVLGLQARFPQDALVLARDS